ncbi:hypothetical protein DIPPA_04161 [Diplonema papillatum]|nr:hypothetical protein DIPPA_04161 [Diplonema papillatum]
MPFSPFPRQNSSFGPTATLMEDILTRPEKIGDAQSNLNDLPLDQQIKHLEVMRTLQQERINKMMKVMKEKQQQQQAKEAEKKTFTAAEREKIRAIFDRFDVDSSGEIDKDEFKSMVTALGVTVPEQDVKAAMSSLSSGGSISFEDFLEWWGSDSTRGGHKGLSLAIARTKLRALGRTNKLTETWALEEARVKAGVGVPIETNVTVKIGNLEVPRSGVKLRVASYSKEEFTALAHSRFADHCPDADKPPFLFFETRIELRTADVDAVNTIEAVLQEMARQAGKIEGVDELSVRAVRDDLPVLLIQGAVACEKVEECILVHLTGSPTPDDADLSKLNSEVDLNFQLGVNADDFCRRMLEESISAIHLLDDGASLKMKAKLAPTLVALLTQIWSGAMNNQDLVVRKAVELTASSCFGAFVELLLGSPATVLEQCIAEYVKKIRNHLPDSEVDEEIEKELDLLHEVLRFLSTMIFEKDMTISNTPLVDFVESIKAHNNHPSWPATCARPLEAFFQFAAEAKEIRSFQVWTRFQTLSVEGLRLAPFSLLPRSEDEFDRYLIRKLVAREYAVNYDQVRAEKTRFPRLTEYLSEMYDDENIVTAAFQNIVNAKRLIEESPLDRETPS